MRVALILATMQTPWRFRTKRNHNCVLKDVFKGAATAATARPGPLQDFYLGMVDRGMREELTRVTLARKIAAITLRLWKRGERCGRRLPHQPGNTTKPHPAGNRG